MNIENISELLQYGERINLECKKAQNDVPASVWETYSAFANCYGGVIILGVRENEDGSWVMTGLQNTAKIRKEFWL